MTKDRNMSLQARVIAWLQNVQHKQSATVFERIALACYGYYRAIKIRTPASIRTFVRGKPTFFTFEEAVGFMRAFSESLSDDYDIVVGIPRSGLLFALVFGAMRGIAVSTPELFPNVVWKSGKIPNRNVRKVLLLDDSVSEGTTMRDAAALLTKQNPGLQVDTAALFVRSESAGTVDYHYQIVDGIRLFEWNILHTRKGSTVVDFDGVLCDDPPAGIDQESGEYRSWVRNVRARHIPRFPVDAIVSNRPQLVEKETREWLDLHGVVYKQLLLHPLPKSRRASDDRHAFKIASLKKLKPDIYWESSVGEAKAIAAETGVPVFCWETHSFF